MSHESGSHFFRGVVCMHCGKSVHLPALVLSKELAFRTQEQDSEQDLLSRVFPLRCRTCGKESIYAMPQIHDCVEATNTDISTLLRDNAPRRSRRAL